MLENMLISIATGGTASGPHYGHIRRLFMEDHELSPLLPAFVRTSRTPDAFWQFINTKRRPTLSGGPSFGGRLRRYSII